MSLTVTQNEGTMVITITSNPKSKWPILCQMLGSLCGPVCFLFEYMRKQLPATQRPFGVTETSQTERRKCDIVQIGVVIRNLMLGCFGLVFFLLVLPFDYNVTSYGGLFNTMMMLSVLQLFVVIAFFVMTVKSLSMKARGAKLVEDSTSQSIGGIWPYSYPSVNSCNMTFAVTQDLKDKLTDTHTALGIEQIIVGVMNITVGCFGFGSSFLIGGVFLVVGIMSVLAVKFPSHGLLVILVFLNIVSAAMAVSAIVLYSLDLAMGNNVNCYENSLYYSTDSDFAGSRFDSCLYYKDLSQMILGGLDVMMIVLSVLQLGVAISFCVLTGKILCKNTEDAETAVDPELKKGILENTTASSA